MTECVAGCRNYTGGEVRHHPDCPFYPESLSKMLDDALDKNNQLMAIVAKPIFPRIDPSFWPQLMHIVGVLLDMDGGPEVLKAWGKLEDDARNALSTGANP